MNAPKLNEYDGWRNSAIGIWFFEHYLQGYADLAAIENGKAAGTWTDIGRDHMNYVRNAGHVSGVEFVINNDPFEGEREELDENISGGETPTD